ncbi:hypothetical protein NDU88_007162 [Pleurodeles waltl]|uniref:Uncharacterized protein n=1 Tax=Pleurodeles waltl TaxID=8319 RepID=A0AAV7WFD1_PLEWA|nr:hypothetical protein NDU88_007162 [Pleurodeles waltl]
MSLWLPLKGKRHATFISAYVSTMTNPEEIKDKFYEDLESLIASNLSEDFNSQLDQLSFGTNGAEEDWAPFRDVAHNTALSHLDQNTRKHQDWFNDSDEDIQKLLDEKREAFRSLQQDTTSVSIKSKVQAKLREMHDSWLTRKADGI